RNPHLTFIKFFKGSTKKRSKRNSQVLMAKKSLNESRKSTIQKVVALTAHSNSSEHSSSSSKHKKSNGSTRSGTSTLDSSMYSNSDSDEDEGMSSVELIEFCEKIQNLNKQIEKKKNADVKKNHLLPPSVQKAPRQVPNLHHAKSHQKAPPSLRGKPPHMKRRFQQMHTYEGPKQVWVPKTSLICKLRSLAAIHYKWIQDIGCARQEMIGEHSVSTHSEVVSTHSG
ncbi:hypothetical protein Taro_004397, partial [Colocasia esculenta]|nr:hypothetical protein [Colocasia esculenta]